MKTIKGFFSLVLLSQILSFSASLNAMYPKGQCTVNCVGSSCTACVSSGDGTWYCGQISAGDAAHFCD